MANLFWADEKAPQKEAEKALRQHVSGVCDHRFTVKFQSDDGGSHITLYLEVEEVDESLPIGLYDSLNFAKWMGWRFLIMKCPIGYISAIMEAPQRDY